MHKRTLIYQTILLSLTLIILSGCEGYYFVTGSIHKNIEGYQKPVALAVVNIYCGKNWLRGSTISDSLGQFSMSGLTKPTKANYYIVFEKEGFKTDTVIRKGSRGKTFIFLQKIMTEN